MHITNVLRKITCINVSVVLINKIDHSKVVKDQKIEYLPLQFWDNAANGSLVMGKSLLPSFATIILGMKSVSSQMEFAILGDFDGSFCVPFEFDLFFVDNLPLRFLWWSVTQTAATINLHYTNSSDLLKYSCLTEQLWVWVRQFKSKLC